MSDKKLIVIPTNLRIEVPANMSEADIQKLVNELNIGDFAISPDNAKSTLKSETIEHIKVSDNPEVLTLADQISDVDLWANSDTHEVVNL